MSYEKNFETLKQIVELAKLVEEQMRWGDLKYRVEKLEEYAKGLFLRAPYQVGDHVELAETPEITAEKSWGWLGSKHFLIKGATAVVADMDFRAGVFVYGLKFDDDSHLGQWGDDKGKVFPTATKDRAIYRFGERWLRKPTVSIVEAMEQQP